MSPTSCQTAPPRNNEERSYKYHDLISVELNDNNSVNEDELSQWCRDNMASYKLPRKFIFEEIPKTSTGKVQKFTLRDRVKNGDI